MEPIKITEEEINEIELIICSIDALDEHVQIQIKARGQLVKQRKEWWEKLRKAHNLGDVTEVFHLNREKGVIQNTPPKIGPPKKEG